MSIVNLDSVTEALQKAHVSPSGVSFAGKSLKLDSEDDAKPVVEEIAKCSELQYLNLEGNTVGVAASKAIAKALEEHPEFKRALWKDMFTGRMKTEIPKALQYFGKGLVTAGAQLTELDLSDNAFGPVGVEGLASLLRSSSCYRLEVLRLNNNGLGTTGGKLLAAALKDCYHSSRKEGKPLALKVFIAGRNRLENDGAKALAQVFEMIGSLEEIAMPQNGIYHGGISALFEAFSYNTKLQILNLNDNTIGPKGARAVAKALPYLQSLKEINFGDCLLKTKGAVLIANSLRATHFDLETVILGFNEIKKKGMCQLVSAVTNKSKLKSLVLDGNQFGEEGKKELRRKLKEVGKLNTLGSLDDDESEDSEDEETDSSEDEEEESESEEDEVAEVAKPQVAPIDEFIQAPNAENFMAIGDDKSNILLNKAKVNGEIHIDQFISVLMKVASLSNNTVTEVAEASLRCTEMLYRDLFIWSRRKDNTSIVNNAILVNLGLIKTENKKFKVKWNLGGCLYALNNIVKKNYVPESTKNTLKVFMQREVDNNSREFLNIKQQLLSRLL